jgi:indolepyruvate ferredoxin oxidoreductase beta subunit
VHFRIGKPISPLIPYGKADLMIAMEPTEALRYIEYLKDGGVVISSRRIMPPPGETEAVALDKKKTTGYFSVEEIEKRLRKVTSRLVLLDSIGLATQAGNPRTENSVLVGAVTACPDFPVAAEQVRKALLEMVPPTTREANSIAFDLGRKSGGSCLEA